MSATKRKEEFLVAFEQALEDKGLDPNPKGLPSLAHFETGFSTNRFVRTTALMDARQLVRITWQAQCCSARTAIRQTLRVTCAFDAHQLDDGELY